MIQIVEKHSLNMMASIEEDIVYVQIEPRILLDMVALIHTTKLLYEAILES